MNLEKFISNRVREVKPSGIRKFFNMVAEVPDVISLSIGQPDFVTPLHIREACIEALDRGMTGYTHNLGIIELRRGISHFLHKKYKADYDPTKEILVTVGGSEALDLSFRTLVSEGDEVLIPDPAFVSYEPLTILAGGKPVFVPTYEEDNFVIKPENIEKKITERTKVLVLNYPNNPTGAIMTRGQLEAIAEVVKKYNLFVISDEMYSELTYGRKHESFASIPGMKERTILTNGFSKAYSMTGWRLGYIAAPAEIIENMIKIHQYSIACAPSMCQYAAVEAINNGDADIEEMVKEYDKRRKFIYEGLLEIGLDCFEPLGAFYIFPSIKKTGLTSEEFSIRLLNQEKVAVVPGSVFGEHGEGYIRISYAASMDAMEEALRRMKRFLDSL